MKRQILPILLICTLILFNGCTKKGPEGPSGKDGKDGNANIKSTTLTFSSWSWDTTNGYDYCNFTWPEITSSIALTGTVYIYVYTTYGWAALPRTLYPNATYSESQRYTYDTGTFRIIVQDSDLTAPSPALGTWLIKVIAVESSGIQKHPGLNWKNYDEVKKTFNLKD